MTKLIVALFFLGLNGYVFWYMGNDEVIPARNSFVEFPNDLGEWSGGVASGKSSTRRS